MSGSPARPGSEAARPLDADAFPPEVLALLAAVPGLWRRTRGSANPGLSATRGLGGRFLFRGHREYRLGDDLRRVDWNVLGRLDRVVVREYEGERDARTEVWLDASASMVPFGGRVAALRAAALCCAIGVAGGGRVRLGILREGRAETRLEGAEPACVRDALAALSVEPFDGRLRGADALRALAPRLPARARWFLVSDLWTDADPTALHAFAGKGLCGALVHLRVPEAFAPPPGASWSARDPETGRAITVRGSEALSARVAAREEAHAQRWARAAPGAGLRAVAFTPHTPLAELLRRFAAEVA